MTYLFALVKKTSKTRHVILDFNMVSEIITFESKG